MNNVLKIILLFLFICTRSLILNAQAFDLQVALKDLSGLKIEKQKMFPVDATSLQTKSDTVVVQAPSKESLDNPNAYEYRLNPSEVKTIFPDIVYKVDEEEVIDYYSLFPILLELITNQQNQIEELKNQIIQIKTEIQ